VLILQLIGHSPRRLNLAVRTRFIIRRRWNPLANADLSGRRLSRRAESSDSWARYAVHVRARRKTRRRKKYLKSRKNEIDEKTRKRESCRPFGITGDYVSITTQSRGFPIFWGRNHIAFRNSIYEPNKASSGHSHE